MQLLQEVDKPGSDIESYAASLDSTLAHKMEIISSLRDKLSGFRSHLREEKVLSKKFFEQQNEINDVFDLNDNLQDKQDINAENDDAQMLTHDLTIPMSN